MLQRNAWVDYAKAIGIILVVYGHVARGIFNAGLPFDKATYQLADSIVYSFHMPLFFFLSGVFFQQSMQRRGAAGLVVSKIDTIVYPYLLWSVLQGTIEVLLSKYTNGNVGFNEVFSLWIPRAQFWFLYALFLCFLFGVCIYRTAHHAYTLFIVLVFAGIYTFPENFLSIFPLNFLSANFIFFALGVWFKPLENKLQSLSWIWLVLFAMLFFIGQFVFHIVEGKIYLDRGIGTLGLACISILFIISLSMFLARISIRWLQWIGSASMVIYLMHILAGSGARVILNKFLVINNVTLHLLIGCFIGIVAPMLVLQGINKLHCHWLLIVPRALSAQFWYGKLHRQSVT